MHYIYTYMCVGILLDYKITIDLWIRWQYNTLIVLCTLFYKKQILLNT